MDNVLDTRTANPTGVSPTDGSVIVPNNARPGDSGGIVVNSAGRYVGTITSGASDDSLAFYTPVKLVRRVLERAVKLAPGNGTYRVGGLLGGGHQVIVQPPQVIVQPPQYQQPIGTSNCDLQCQQLGQRITAIELAIAKMDPSESMESDLLGVAGKNIAQDGRLRLLEEDINAGKGETTALAGKLAGVSGLVDEKVAKAGGGFFSAWQDGGWKSVAGYVLKALFSNYGIWGVVLGGGVIGIVVWVVYRKWIKPLISNASEMADKFKKEADANKDGRADAREMAGKLAEEVRYRLDRMDGVINGTYAYIPEEARKTPLAANHPLYPQWAAAHGVAAPAPVQPPVTPPAPPAKFDPQTGEKLT
jgi:hypothetical protein